MAERGRPPLPPERAKRYPLNMRTTKELRERIENAANANGRSLAQEVELRLEQSFWFEDLPMSIGNIGILRKSKDE